MLVMGQLGGEGGKENHGAVFFDEHFVQPLDCIGRLQKRA